MWLSQGVSMPRSQQKNVSMGYNFTCFLSTCPSHCQQQQSQYLYQFVLHAALDALDDAASASKDCHLKVCDVKESGTNLGQGMGQGIGTDLVGTS